ncbi:MAG: sigma 54 modulation/S30EA ribosomal C-terminal domain-containing protein, partial [Phenylobacterium sp.]
MQKRIRRYKNRLTDHHPQALARQAETAAYFVLQSPDDGPGDDDLDGEASGFPEPMVIAETETNIDLMTVSMAVMELDLSESQTIVFRNAAHGGLSVVYRRPDGNIGWIDPKRTKANGMGPGGDGGV